MTRGRPDLARAASCAGDHGRPRFGCALPTGKRRPPPLGRGQRKPAAGSRRGAGLVLGDDQLPCRCVPRLAAASTPACSGPHRSPKMISLRGSKLEPLYPLTFLVGRQKVIPWCCRRCVVADVMSRSWHARRRDQPAPSKLPPGDRTLDRRAGFACDELGVLRWCFCRARRPPWLRGEGMIGAMRR